MSKRMTETLEQARTPDTTQDERPRQELTIFLRGRISGKSGGAGAVIIDRHGVVSSIGRGYAETNEHRVELLALILALCVANAECCRCELSVFTDSKYMMFWLERIGPDGFKGSLPTANYDLWQKVAALCAGHKLSPWWRPPWERGGLIGDVDGVADEALKTPHHYDFGYEDAKEIDEVLDGIHRLGPIHRKTVLTKLHDHNQAQN